MLGRGMDCAKRRGGKGRGVLEKQRATSQVVTDTRTGGRGRRGLDKSERGLYRENVLF